MVISEILRVIALLIALRDTKLIGHDSLSYIAERLSCFLKSQRITHQNLFISWRGTHFSSRASFQGNFGIPCKMAVSCSEGMETQVLIVLSCLKNLPWIIQAF